MDSENSSSIHRLTYKDKEIILIGTAHISKHSVETVTSVIETEKPDTVCVEICESRYQAIKSQDRWKDTDIIKVLKEKKGMLLFSSIILSSFQRRLGEKLDSKAGQEIISAVEIAEKQGAKIVLADRDIRTTMSRTWKSLRFIDKIKLIFQFIMSIGQTVDIKEQEIEDLKKTDAIESIVSELENTIPGLKKPLIDERDLYLTAKIRDAMGQKIVAVVGAGHVPGIKEHLTSDINIEELEQKPPKSKSFAVLKWLLPSCIAALFILGFFWKGANTGTDMIALWIIVNGLLAGLGALAAFAHPITIISSIIAAPLTSLNPMIAAGWVAGLVEAFYKKPKVADFESLHDDVATIKGLWKNRVTRILLVVVFTNLGSAVGTFAAIPMLLRLMH